MSYILNQRMQAKSPIVEELEEEELLMRMQATILSTECHQVHCCLGPIILTHLCRQNRT